MGLRCEVVGLEDRHGWMDGWIVGFLMMMDFDVTDGS